MEKEKEHMHSPSSASFKQQHQYSINWQQITNNARNQPGNRCTETSNRWLSLSNFNWSVFSLSVFNDYVKCQHILHVCSGGRSRCRFSGWGGNGGRGSASRYSHHAVTTSWCALAVLHNHVGAKIKHGSGTGTCCSARNRSNA